MEFHAIILCGIGKSLSPLSKVRSTGVPKALLPVANRPMIDYVLEWCEKAFFPHVTVVADEQSSEEIGKALEEYKLKKVSKDTSDESEAPKEIIEGLTSIELLTIESESSGEVLSHLYKSNFFKNQQNFVILPCDFITNLPPQVLIEAYRNKEDSDLGTLFYYKNQLEIEDKKSKTFPKSYTIYSESKDGQSQLLDIYSAEDIDFHKSLKIRTQMCWRYPNSIITTNLLNSFIFFGSNKIFEIMDESQQKFNESYFKNRSITKIIRDLARRSWRHSEVKETIGFCELPEQATFFRSNNLPVLMEANRYFMKLQATNKSQHQSQPKDKSTATVGVDSLIGNATTLGEKTNVKRTVVGSSCQIGKRVKLTGCLILNNVIIEDDVQLENCIIGQGALIHSKLRLTNCNVESTLEVSKNTQSKGETLLCFTLEGIVDGEESADSLESDSEDNSGSDSTDEYDAYDDEFADNDDGLFAR